MNRIRVAIIDDGINGYIKNPYVVRYEIKNNLVKKVYSIDEDKISHGTICGVQFIHFARNYSLYSLNIKQDKECVGTVENLIIAFKWCIDNDIKLINLSIGTTNFNNFEVIENEINKLMLYGIIVVAAYDNCDKLTYPAALPNVIGVRCNKDENLKSGEYIYNINSREGIDIIACGEYDKNVLCKYFVNNKYLLKDIKKCNSYATPSITARVCNIMSEGVLEIDKIRNKLRDKAKFINTIQDFSMKKSEVYKEFKASFSKIYVPNIVVFNDSSFSTEDILEELINKFKVSKYNCVAVSSKIEKSIIDKSLYKIEEIGINNELEHIYCMTNPDIMITALDKKEDIWQLKDNDLVDILLYFFEYEGDYRQDIKVKLYSNIDLSSQLSQVYKKCVYILKG